MPKQSFPQPVRKIQTGYGVVSVPVVGIKCDFNVRTGKLPRNLAPRGNLCLLKPYMRCLVRATEAVWCVRIVSEKLNTDRTATKHVRVIILFFSSLALFCFNYLLS